MKTYYIFRHGETFATKKGRGYGMRIFSAPILPEAGVPLQKMGEYLKSVDTDFQVSSALLRCRQTADIITTETGKTFVFDKRLNEYFLETFGHLRKRLQEVLTEIDKNDYKNIVICTHGACIAMLISILTARHEKPTAFNLFRYPPPGVLTIINNNNVQEINFNGGLYGA
jgi:broad specificity phosphatase PhoE